MGTPVALPGSDERIRCAEFTRAAEVDPGGTAIQADLLLAVETPQPWPKPVFDHEILSGLDDVMRNAAQPTRILAAVPRTSRLESDPFDVVAYRRTDTGVERQVWGTALESLRPTVEAIVNGDEPTDADLAEGAHDTSEIWICAQGTHDVCCGTEGSRLAMEVEARRPDVIVRRVSHTGGHRFAPTAMTLPDGRMWGNLTPTLIDAILDRTAPPSELVRHCRGWWGCAPGTDQMAERAVWAELGWEWTGGVVVTTSDGPASEHRVTGSMPEGDVAFRVGVTVGREVPTIACRAPGGLPAKPGRELAVTHVEREAT